MLIRRGRFLTTTQPASTFSKKSKTNYTRAQESQKGSLMPLKLLALHRLMRTVIAIVELWSSYRQPTNLARVNPKAPKVTVENENREQWRTGRAQQCAKSTGTGSLPLPVLARGLACEIKLSCFAMFGWFASLDLFLRLTLPI